MRFNVLITFLFILSLTHAQLSQNDLYSLNKAISVALNNNPFADSIEKQLKFEVKSNWHLLIFHLNKLKLLTEYEKVLDGYSRLINLKYSSGEIDILESYKLNEKVASIQTAVSLTLNECEISNNNLQQLLFINHKIIPADTNLYIYEIDKGFKNSLSDTLFSNNTLNYEYEKFKELKVLENKQLELDNLFTKLLLYKNYRIDLAELLVQTASSKYSSEDIDFIEFVDYISEAYNIRLEYIEILNMYNQKAIKLEYYAY